MKISMKQGAALVGILAAMAGPASAQTAPQVIQVSEATLAALLGGTKASAGASFGAPLAFGANWGDVGAGVFATTVGGKVDDGDGSMGLVMGFGDSKEAVGLEVSLGLSSLVQGAGSDDGFGDNGSFGLKLHTALPDGAAFAVGISSIGRWGNANDAVKSAVYAVGSKSLQVPVGGSDKTIVLNLGVGDSSYNEPGKDGVGLIASGAFFFTKQVSLIGNYTGGLTGVAVSVAPIASQPLTLTVGATNLAERFGGEVEYAASLGYGFHF